MKTAGSDVDQSRPRLPPEELCSFSGSMQLKWLIVDGTVAETVAETW